MTSAEFEKVVHDQFERCSEVLGVKNDEYTLSNEDRLRYFKRAAVLTWSNPKSALFGMLVKHLISVSDMCNSSEKFSEERWSEKITDSINYLLLLRAVVTEEQQNN